MKSFWDYVAVELEYLGMTNKTLAEKVGITASNIGKGQKQGSCPAADTAVKIAKVLNVSVEYLVTGKTESTKNKTAEAEQNALRIYHKYHAMLDTLETLSDAKKAYAQNLVQALKDL